MARPTPPRPSALALSAFFSAAGAVFGVSVAGLSSPAGSAVSGASSFGVSSFGVSASGADRFPLSRLPPVPTVFPLSALLPYSAFPPARRFLPPPGYPHPPPFPARYRSAQKRAAVFLRADPYLFRCPSCYHFPHFILGNYTMRANRCQFFLTQKPSLRRETAFPDRQKASQSLRPQA